MGPYLLEYAGLEMPNYFKFLKSFSKQLPVISRSYAIDKGKNIIASNSEKYNSSLNTISIEDVTIQENNAIIRGNNFYPKSLLFINSKPHRYQYVNQSEIHLSKNIMRPGAKLEIKLFDSKNNTLAKSNTYIY